MVLVAFQDAAVGQDDLGGDQVIGSDPVFPAEDSQPAAERQPGAPPPPPYKMAVLTWAAIFPLITLVVLATAPLIGPWPLVPRLAVTTAVTVSAMTWVVMPRMTRLLRRWLYPGRRRPPPGS
jgi:hypothetical protein